MTICSAALPRYEVNQTYAWNYEHAPDPMPFEVPKFHGDWRFCGLSVDSPLGISAGPLLNGGWVLYYAALGFDVLTYKTVRSRPRECYPLPNLQPVRCQRVSLGESTIPAAGDMSGSWAISFGMPSMPPDVWRADIEATRAKLPKGKLLSVSVVGSAEPGWSIERLADDYALCAAWAFNSGADCIEANLSCPNVATLDGQLYHQPRDAAIVAQAIRQKIGAVPLILKIGHLTSPQQCEALLRAVAPDASALSMINTIAAKITGPDEKPLFSGERRGIGGECIREAALDQVAMFSRLVRQHHLPLELISGGGIATAGHVHDSLAAGASAVHMATAAMLNPLAGIEIRRGWTESRCASLRFAP